MADAGLQVQPTKSKFWSPTADLREASCRRVHPAVHELAALVKRSKGGLDLLGGAAATEHDVATLVTTDNLTTITVHAEKRLDKTRYFAERVREYLTAQTTPYDTHKAWMIATKSTAKAFSYDAALISREVLEPAVKPVADMVEAIFSLCSGGIQDEPDAQVQIGIAPCFGGCGARFEGVGLQSDAAFYSTWTFLTKRMGTLFDSKGWPRRPMAGWSDACKAKDRLLAAGVEVDLDGGVRFTPAAEQLYTRTPWVQDFPVRENSLQASPIIAASRVGGWMPGRVPRRMIGRICKHLDAIQAAKLYNQTRGTDTKDHAYKKQVLLSSGGRPRRTYLDRDPRSRPVFPHLTLHHGHP